MGMVSREWKAVGKTTMRRVMMRNRVMMGRVWIEEGSDGESGNGKSMDEQSDHEDSVHGMSGDGGKRSSPPYYVTTATIYKARLGFTFRLLIPSTTKRCEPSLGERRFRAQPCGEHTKTGGRMQSTT